MPLMLQEVYAALLEAGASEEKSQAAAVAIASYDNQLREIRQELQLLRYTIDRSVVESRVVRGIMATIAIGIMWRVW